MVFYGYSQLFVAIVSYFILNYFQLREVLLVIFGNWRLFHLMLLLVILGYIITSYLWLLYWWLLVVISDYFINEY
jgi:hypothetical protein